MTKPLRKICLSLSLVEGYKDITLLLRTRIKIPIASSFQGLAVEGLDFNDFDDVNKSASLSYNDSLDLTLMCLRLCAG